MADAERIAWQSYPSWAHFTWLYLFATFAVVRGGLMFASGLEGGAVWIAGAGALLLCVALLRRWAYYVVTPTKVAVRNGYTGGETDAIAYADMTGIAVEGGPVASLLGIGTLLIHAGDQGRVLRFRGIRDPEIVRRRIEALAPAPER